PAFSEPSHHHRSTSPFARSGRRRRPAVPRRRSHGHRALGARAPRCVPPGGSPGAGRSAGGRRLSGCTAPRRNESSRTSIMTEDAKTFLFELMNTPSPSGFEVEGQRKWAAYVRPHADEVASDTYGNAWATLHGSGGEEAPRIMLEAHADEIGFMVNYISDEGFLSITRIGGSDRAIARGRRVRILGSKGEVRGVIGNTAIHLRDTKDEKMPEWHELFVDVGARSREE